MTTLMFKIRSFVLDKKFNKVLDVGCGEKPYRASFDCVDYIGIDVEKSGRSAKTADLYFDGINIPFPDNFFDFILCTQVIEHAKDADRLISEMKRVLEPGGYLLVTVPFIWGEHEVPYDFRRYTSFGLKDALLDNQFELVDFCKLDEGFISIKKLIHSELIFSTAFESTRKLVKLKVSLSLIMLRFISLLLKDIPFKRVYLDNYIVVKKVQ